MIRACNRSALGVLFCLGCCALAGAGEGGADPPSGWLPTVIENIRQAEYEFSLLEGEIWSAPNRSQDLRSFVSAEGLRVVPRRPVDRPWEIGLQLVGFGRGESPADPGSPIRPVTAAGHRIELRRPALTEWYVNRPDGIEQGFDIPAPPAQGPRHRPVVLEMRVAGEAVADLTDGAQEALLRTSTGQRVLRYGHLVVRDATGRTLASWLETAGDRIRIVTDDEGAIYPLLVDPLVTVPDWSAESNQAGAEYGISVASAGDVNGDGYDDVIVGAQSFDNVEADEGVVFVYYGSATGPSVMPSWTAESNQAYAEFGRPVASAGDVNGDGYDDVIIGASEYDDDPGGGLEYDEGWAFVFLGSPTGLPGGPNTNVSSAAWTAEGEQVEAEFGRWVASAGDVNNDGYDDVIIGASEYTNDQDFEGLALLYLGSASGLGPPGTPFNADWRDEGDQVNCLFGHAMASAGDVNNDGRDDVIVGARDHEVNFNNEGRVLLYLGTPTGLSANPVWIRDGGQRDMRLGVSVDSAGDVDGDGYDDVVVGADIYSNGQTWEGGAFLYLGTPSAQLGTTPAWTTEANQGEAYLGYTVAGAGDVNNDGYDDVIVGADGFDNTELDEGAAFLFLGSANGLPTAPSRTFEANVEGAGFGTSVAGAGDVNNDGYDDLIIGADLFTKPQVHEGAAFVYFGCEDTEADGVCQSVDNCPDLFNPDQADTDLDGIGDLCDPCQDVDLDEVCDQPRMLIEWAGPGEQVLVKDGSLMRYLANVEIVDPGIVLEWTQLTFPDENFPPWAIGVYGVGYETDPTGGADGLLATTNPPDPLTISVFTRAQFIIDDVNTVTALHLAADWDDGYIAWINGVEVYRSPQMPTGTPLWNTKPLTGHESSNGTAPSFGTPHDISVTGLPALRTGQNVLAIGVWNTNQTSSDLVLVPRLSINRPKGASMRYLANSVDPGVGSLWTANGYDDQAGSWSSGNFGIGYETASGADDLLNSEVPSNTVSIYTRTRVNVDPTTVDSVFLGADYDDGYAVWINGVEVFRSPEMPGTPGTVPPWNADPAPPHESSNGTVPDYEPLHNITGVAKPLLFPGENLVAIGAWNGSTDTDDMVLVPRLSLNEGDIDNCVGDFNPDQSDIDGDGLGDVCDPDIDGDGHANAVDNCPFVANDQSDGDTDGIGDACDSCPDDPGNDADLDGICAGTGYSPPKIGDGDNCPGTYNPPEDCDGLPGTPDEQCDVDGNGVGDACDPDIDGDSVLNGDDNCPYVSNLDQNDDDLDTVGDVCDCSPNNNQAWEVPGQAHGVLMAKFDTCGNYSCSETGGVCAGNLDCDFDQCENQTCSQSLGPCASDAECETDTCENYLCSAGANPCASDLECTADFCDNRTCTAGANPCTGDGDCTADVCTDKMCLISSVSCFSNFDCLGGPGDLCIGQCSIGGNLCANDVACTADVCGDGTCSVGLNVCSDDSVCTADFCEGTCSVGANPCLTDVECTAPQTDLCEGSCSIGLNTCGSDVDCTVPQTDLCEGSCTIGGNGCSSDAACTAPAIDTLFWLEPAVLGGTGVVYDSLRSQNASDFVTSTTCVETDGVNRITSDGTVPAAGVTLFYLIRVENECPDGNMGSSSSGPRTGRACE